MFDQVAERYDLLNDVLSLGLARWWRRAVARAVAAAPGERVLDLAAGTGTSARALITAGAHCVACDFSLGMLAVGARRLAAAHPPAAAAAARPRPASAVAAAAPPGALRFVAGDALRLPFRDRSFDAVTISFGLRNVADTGAALAELHRVTRPGGRLVVCEFSHLRWARADAAYERYLTVALPALARRFSPAADAYSYLAESIAAWPDQAGLARLIRAAGWSTVGWRNLMLGVVALHRARRAL
jgi:demethylmenaquinone methyltransferase/2-methoxy-6-polyprenyl-1,4-benzoquinol methylase